jgi:uncharacterized membrane protein
MTALTAIAAVGSALVGGVWFAFSGFVMQALARLPATDGAAAMQAINVTAVRPPLMLAMFGTAAVCVAAAVAALTGDGDGAGWVLAGAVLYLAGSVGVTIGGNVPLNDALMRVTPEDAGDVWARYQDRWTTWNTVRGVITVAAAAAFAVALAS